MKWFRFYEEVLEDPKVQMLSPELFKFWVNILCMASKYDGKLPPVENIAYHTRATQEATTCHLNALKMAGLIQEFSNQHATWLAPNGWSKRQYKSDSSSDRVKRYRDKKRNAEVTPPETDTEADTDIKNIPKGISKKTCSLVKKYISGFEEFWNLYGIKKGRDKCEKSYSKAISSGVGHEAIMNGLRGYQSESKKNDTPKEFIKNPLTWLNGKHWEDEYEHEPSEAEELDRLRKRQEQLLQAKQTQGDGICKLLN